MAGYVHHSFSVGTFSAENGDEEHYEYSIDQEVDGGGRDDPATYSLQPASNPLTAPAENNTPPEKQRDTSASLAMFA